MCPQHGLISVQGESEEKQDNPEDPGSNPYCHQESSLEAATGCSKEPSAQPAAISFWGALMIPVRSRGDGKERGSLGFSVGCQERGLQGALWFPGFLQWACLDTALEWRTHCSR